MSSVAVYSSRSRASERQRNIRNDMNRASAYIMSNDYKNDYASNLLNTSSTLYSSSRDGYSSSKIARRPRDSSLGALGRPNRDSSLTRTGTYTRDSSLPRFKETHIALKSTAPTSLITSIISNRHSIALPSVPVLDSGLGSETAKYQRQHELKEIHNNFMKGFKDTNNKLNGDIDNAEEQAERRSKAYAKIIGEQSNYMADQEYQRQNYSDMFIDTGKFSTRTLSAIKNLDGTTIKKKTRNPEEYQWRKDMEQYEKSSEYEKEKRIRTIANSSNRRNFNDDDTEGKENKKNLSIQNRSRNALLNINNSNKETSSKPPQSPKAKPKIKEATKPVPKIENKPATASKATKPVKPVAKDEVIEPPTPPRKTWREKVAEQEKEEMEEKRKQEEEKKRKEEEALKKENETLTEEEKQERDEAKAAARAIREKIEAQLAEQFPIEPPKKSAKTNNTAPGEAEASPDSESKSNEDGEREDEDSHGTKKMKSDFDAKMIAMEQEMSAGRSKLAKLRERIRRAKGVVKEADTAIDDSKKS